MNPPLCVDKEKLKKLMDDFLSSEIDLQDHYIKSC